MYVCMYWRYLHMFVCIGNPCKRTLHFDNYGMSLLVTVARCYKWSYNCIIRTYVEQLMYKSHSDWMSQLRQHHSSSCPKDVPSRYVGSTVSGLLWGIVHQCKHPLIVRILFDGGLDTYIPSMYNNCSCVFVIYFEEIGQLRIFLSSTYMCQTSHLGDGRNKLT